MGTDLDASEVNDGLPVMQDREDMRTSEKKNILQYGDTTTLVVRSTNVDIMKRAIQDADQLTLWGRSSSGLLELLR